MIKQGQRKIKSIVAALPGWRRYSAYSLEGIEKVETYQIACWAICTDELNGDEVVPIGWTGEWMDELSPCGLFGDNEVMGGVLAPGETFDDEQRECLLSRLREKRGVKK